MNIGDDFLKADENITIGLVNITGRSLAQKSEALLRNCFLRDAHAVLVRYPVPPSEARFGASKICLLWGRLRESGDANIVYKFFAGANIVNESLLAEVRVHLKKLMITHYIIWSHDRDHSLICCDSWQGPKLILVISNYDKCSNFDFDYCRQ